MFGLGILEIAILVAFVGLVAVVVSFAMHGTTIDLTMGITSLIALGLIVMVVVIGAGVAVAVVAFGGRRDDK